jgi:ankyrin repeat protein
VHVLLDHGADATLKDAQGRVPRDIALQKGKFEAAKML